MRTDLFDYELPEDRIALDPVHPRDAARLLVVRPGRDLQDRIVRDLPSLLEPGDALVVNDTRVIPAALLGVRHRGMAPAARIAFNLVRRTSDNRWLAFARPAKRLSVGDRIQFGEGDTVCLAGALNASVAAKGEHGEVELEFDFTGAILDDAIAAVGAPPLPPYIALKRPPRPTDAADYQSIFAARDGAVAAPTASLHFTPALIEALGTRSIGLHRVTLHVGAGTFVPVKADDTDAHVMHAEWGEVTAPVAAALNATRANGGRIVAVGSTSLRILETAAAPDGVLAPFSGDTSVFIVPGYRFKAVDALLTNFHLPRSTLLMLVAAFIGYDEMQKAYAHAIAERYRFYSFGDASLLFRA